MYVTVQVYQHTSLNIMNVHKTLRQKNQRKKICATVQGYQHAYVGAEKPRVEFTPANKFQSRLF